MRFHRNIFVCLPSNAIFHFRLSKGQNYSWVVPLGMSHLHFIRPIELFKRIRYMYVGFLRT